MKTTPGALTKTIITIKGNNTSNNKQKSETKIYEIVTKQIHLHNSNLEKQAVPMIHKVQYIGRIKSANFNIIKCCSINVA